MAVEPHHTSATSDGHQEPPKTFSLQQRTASGRFKLLHFATQMDTVLFSIGVVCEFLVGAIQESANIVLALAMIPDGSRSPMDIAWECTPSIALCF